MTIRCVLLAGRSGDPEFIAIESVLRRIGVPCVRIDADKLGELDIALDVNRGLLVLNGLSVVPTITWVRHLSLDTGVGDKFAHYSWVALVKQLTAWPCATFPGTAPGQLQQLREASRVGIRVPRTVVSTDRRAVPSAWRRVVVKAIDLHYVEWPAGSFTWFLPEILDRTESPTWQRRGLPALWQEYMEHEAELRVYFVLGHIYAFEVEKSCPSDIWLAPERVRVRPVEAPHAVIEATSTLAALWRMTFGAFDFLLRDGEPIFLEINADGGWRWFESKGGFAPVTQIVANTLRSLHNAAAGSVERLDLTTFLTG